MMKNKKILKILISLFILLIIGLMIANNSFAWDMHLEDYNDADITNAGKAGEKVTGIMGAVINLATTVGAGVAIIMLIVIGITYVTQGPNGKAEAKKDLEGYIIGAVILFGVSGILKLLQMFIDANLNNV